MNPFGTGAKESPYDIRTFAYKPDQAAVKGGSRYLPEDIDHQHKVGICTAISMTMNAGKVLGIKFSPDFQYLIQKLEYDMDWMEGSSISSALKVGLNVGFLPIEHFKKYITESDRKLPYYLYIKKLQAIPKAEIEKLKIIAGQNRLQAFAKVAIDRDLLAQAIDESQAGILVRFGIDRSWWTEPVEPLRAPKIETSGHAVNESNYDGGSFRIANSWGTMWADKGTAYHLLSTYKPTEAWIPYFNTVPPHVQTELEKRKALMGQILDLVQKLLKMLQK